MSDFSVQFPTTQGARIAALRQARDLSQRQLAELSGVPLRTIQQYEQWQKNINRAQVEHLAMMAQVLHCESNSLYESINN